MVFRPMEGGNSPVIDTGGFDTTAPSGGGASAPPSGGAATNMRQSSTTVPYHDQWMHAPIFAGWQKANRGPSVAKPGTDIPVKTGTGRQAVWGTPFQMIQIFRSMSPAAYQEFKNKLVAAGFVSKDAFPADVEGVWKGILQDVQQANQQDVNISPTEYLHSLIRKNGFKPKDIPATAGWDPTEAAAAAQGDGFTPSTSTVKSVYDLDPADAEDLLTNTLAQKLGRDPAREEVEDFVDAVKARALQDPSTVTTRTRRGDLSGQAGPGTQVEVLRQGGKTYSTVTEVNEGFAEQDAARIAERRARNAPDYASYQSVATYFPALLQALGSTV